ncbi:MAG: DEAD/DEAH box helicase [Alphaproteobacteria bacterium]|nr:DEAD/DEAH box helicase [Alphaproteobacteria bacterium]
MTHTVRFDRGTLVLEGFAADEVPPSFRFDPRVGLPRGHARHYHDVVLDLHRRGVPYVDEARAYAPLEGDHALDRVPRPYQAEAVDAWMRAGRRGVIVLPTGAGKSFVAELCIARAGRTALVVAPTIDLVGQWYDQLVRAFGEPIGLLGGGHHDLQAITVSTYDSAWMHVERWGARFGTIVFDEVHHLPGPSFAQAAEGSLAPFRLGLTATLERPDGGHQLVEQLVGPVAYRKEISELAGDFLADYRTEVLRVHLSAADRAAYEQAVATWRGFVESEGIRLGGAGGWSAFLRACARSSAGREAFKAWRRSRSLVQAAPAKLRLTAELLRRHAEGRCIVFTNDNATVYEVSRALLVPAITHQTDLKERRALLAAFASGELPVLVTSRVLNEGVDVPAADVAIVLSGTSTVREHVQRLGRILRPQEGKQAVLYELVVADSSDETTSRRRREHDAYR